MERSNATDRGNVAGYGSRIYRRINNLRKREMEMTIHCSKCREAFSSLLLPQEKALEELGNKLATHCATKHQGDIRKLNEDGGKMGAIAMWLMLLRRFAAVPESETFIRAEIDKHADEVLEILGFEILKKEVRASPAD